MLTRRSFLATTTAAFATSSLGALPVSSQRKKVAFLGTVVTQHSHAQHFLDRHTLGYTWGGKWVAPRFDVASVYIDQFPKNDLAVDSRGFRETNFGRFFALQRSC